MWNGTADEPGQFGRIAAGPTRGGACPVPLRFSAFNGSLAAAAGEFGRSAASGGGDGMAILASFNYTSPSLGTIVVALLVAATLLLLLGATRSIVIGICGGAIS